MKKINLALEFASKKHEGQIRKGVPVPYIVHIWEVYQILREYTDDENTLVAAILHDTVEDTNTTLQEIEDNFGLEVKNLVDFCSEHDKTIPYLQRKAEHAARMKNAPNKAKLTKCADCISNWETTALDIKNGGDPWQNFHADKETVKLNYTMSLIALYEIKFCNKDMYDRLLNCYTNLFGVADRATLEKAKDLIANSPKLQTKKEVVAKQNNADASNEKLNKKENETNNEYSIFKKFLDAFEEERRQKKEEEAKAKRQKMQSKQKSKNTAKLAFDDCRLCPNSEESLDPDPDDWMRDDDTKVKCNMLNRYVARSLEGWHENVPIPRDCPLKKL